MTVARIKNKEERKFQSTICFSQWHLFGKGQLIVTYSSTFLSKHVLPSCLHLERPTFFWRAMNLSSAMPGCWHRDSPAGFFPTLCFLPAFLNHLTLFPMLTFFLCFPGSQQRHPSKTCRNNGKHFFFNCNISFCKKTHYCIIYCTTWFP